jgi:hypothetical protein
MSFSDALNKAKAPAKTEQAWEGDAASRAQATTITSRPRNTQEDEEGEEKEEVELRIPGSFDFGFADPDGAARETPGAGTVNPFDAVSVLGNLWRRMQVR